MEENIIASNSIILTPVNDGFTVLVSPSSCTISADFNGGNQNLDRAFADIKLFLGPKQLAFKLNVVEKSNSNITYEIEIVVAHYPPYCSKWNPIEHRAFSFISKKWQGVKFDNYDIIKELAEQTTTKTGFTVMVHIDTKIYEIGQKASEEFIQTMPVIFDSFLPKWNYKFDYK